MPEWLSELGRVSRLLLSMGFSLIGRATDRSLHSGACHLRIADGTDWPLVYDDQDRRFGTLRLYAIICMGLETPFLNRG